MREFCLAFPRGTNKFTPRLSRFLIYSAVVCLTLEVASFSESPPGITLNGHVQNSEGRSIPHVVVVVSNGFKIETSDSGDFQLKLPSDLQPGDPIQITVLGWVVVQPAEGQRGQKFIQRSNTAPVKIVVVVTHKGDAELLSAAEIKRMVVQAVQQAREGAPADHDDFIATQADKLGFTQTQVKTAIEHWLNDVQGPYERGLAASFQGEYETARGLIAQSITPAEKDLVEKYIALADADHLSAHFDAAVASLNKALALQPQNPAVLNALGHNLDHIGRVDSAISYVKEARRIFEELEGPNGEDVALALQNLGTFYGEQGDLQNAEDMDRRALAIMQTATQPEPVVVALTQSDLAQTLAAEGEKESGEAAKAKFGEAEKFIQQAETTMEHQGPTWREYLSKVLLIGGELYTAEGDFAKADDYLNRGISAAKDTEGSNGYNVSAGKRDLAKLRLRELKLSEAEALMVDAAAIQKVIFGESGASYGDYLNFLGLLYELDGKQSEADAVYEKSLRASIANMDEKNPQYPLQAYKLSQILENEGKSQEAAGLHKTSMATNSIDLAHYIRRAAERKVSDHKYQEAERLYRDALTIDEKILPPESAERIADTAGLAEVLKAQGKPLEDSTRPK